MDAGHAEPGNLSFSSPSLTINENVGTAEITVNRSDGTDGIVSAYINIADINTTTTDYILTPAGALDTLFAPSITSSGGWVYSVVVQNDNKLLIGGNFTSINGSSRNHIARLN